MHFALNLHSGIIGGATRLAERRASRLRTQRAARLKSDAFMGYVKQAGDGAAQASRMLK